MIRKEEDGQEGGERGKRSKKVSGERRVRLQGQVRCVLFSNNSREVELGCTAAATGDGLCNLAPLAGEREGRGSRA